MPRDLLDEMLALPAGEVGDQAKASLLVARELRALRRAVGDAVGLALTAAIRAGYFDRADSDALLAEYRKRFAAEEG